jgi:capsular exopolysaccharide synthesis family protein
MTYQRKSEASDFPAASPLPAPLNAVEPLGPAIASSTASTARGGRARGPQAQPAAGALQHEDHDDAPGARPRPPARAGGYGTEVEFLRRLAGAARRQIGLVAAVAALITACVIATVVSLSPRYSATTLLVVDQRDAQLVGASAERPSEERIALSVDGEVEIMKSHIVARTVVERLRLDRDPRFGGASGEDERGLVARLGDGVLAAAAWLGQAGPEAGGAAAPAGASVTAVAERALQGITAIRRRGLTNVIAIEVTADTPTEAAKLANAYAQAYIDNKIQAKLRATEQAEAALAKRVSDLGEALRRSESQIKAFSFVQAGQAGEEAARREVERLQGVLAAATREEGALAARLREAEGAFASRNYAALGQILSAPDLGLLEEQRAALEQRLHRGQEGGQEGGGPGAELRQRLDLVAAQIQAVGQQKVEALRRQRQAGSERVTSLRKEMEQTVQSTDQSTQVSVNLFRLQQEAAATRQLYQDYLGRLKAIVQQRSIVTPDVYVVAEASPPPVKSAPPRTLLVVLGTAFGLVVAAGVGYARDNYPRNIKFVDELEAISGLPNTGVVPAVRSSRWRPGPAPEDMLVEDPTSAYAEAVRRLPVLMNVGPGFGSVLVTSAHPGEGKTTLALSLARAAAEAGLKVVLVDCSLRQPQLHARIGRENRTGLAQVLAGTAAEGATTEIDRLSTAVLMSGGTIGEAGPGRLLQSPRFGKLLRELEGRFDLVILDGPAIGAAADALLIAPQVAAVLLVVRSGRAHPGEVRTAIDQISRTGQTNLATTLNHAIRPVIHSHGYLTGASRA